ncbi:hypothetical protein M3Y99_01067000 [Aphelenchoides fujianensis]|nr:hypothetical protein M3Y99_01067000 [Aphelenchoides fujianensis]
MAIPNMEYVQSNLYTGLATCFLVCSSALMIWYIIEVNTHREYIIISTLLIDVVSTILIGIMAALFSYDVYLNGGFTNF